MKNYELKYGKSVVSVALGKANVIQVIEGKDFPAISNVSSTMRQVLDNPIDSPPLCEILKPTDKIVLLVSDITRSWLKSNIFLPPIVQYLNDLGVPDDNIHIVFALGAHRKQTQQEIEILLGKELMGRLKYTENDARNKDQFIYVGTTSFGTKVHLNKAVIQADKVILTGGVVFHPMCGYSGGRKSILPGVASYETIQQNHLLLCNPPGNSSFINVEHCGTRKTVGNPMHEDQMEIAAFLNPCFMVNVVMNSHGEHARFFAGHYIKAWEEACKLVDQIYCSPLKEQADLVIASCGGFPKDINLYQSAKTIANVSQAVKPGGVAIIFSECINIAEPPDFTQWFDLPDKKSREKELRREFTVPGYTALDILRLMEGSTYIFVSRAENASILKKTGAVPTTSIEEALDVAYKIVGVDAKVIVMPHGANTFPVLM